MRSATVSAALLAALLPCAAEAGVADFLKSCVADAANLDRLPATLAQMGMEEMDPADGPKFIFAGEGQRLWAARTGAAGDAYTGLVPPGPDRPIVICWHVSRPGESATLALADLQKRFPPAPGSVETGTETFYGGYQRWSARVNGTDVLLGVSWPMQGLPDLGTAFLYLARPVPAN